METDVKGQLGGMESSKADRERMAGQSGSWKCGVCGRSNREILEESAREAAAKAEEEGEGSEKMKEEVPEALKIAYKGEAEGDKQEERVGDDDAELAEGFVRTGNATTPIETTTIQSYPPARPAQTVPQPTAPIPNTTAPARITPAPTIPQQQAPQRVQVQVRSNDGVPMWLDRTIAAVVLCLVAMILKVLLGL